MKTGEMPDAESCLGIDGTVQERVMAALVGQVSGKYTV